MKSFMEPRSAISQASSKSSCALPGPVRTPEASQKGGVGHAAMPHLTIDPVMVEGKAKTSSAAVDTQ